MLATLAISAFAAAGGATLVTQAWREHREAMDERARLLDEAAALFPAAGLTIGPDRFPRLDAAVEGGAVTLEVIADTLVTRRLPQLWLKLTLRPAAHRAASTLGVLARPTGAEFWSVTDGLPERFNPAFAAELPVVVRARGAAAADVERAAPTLARLFADPRLKEAVVAPGGIRIVRQVAEGDRGAHMLFRQVRFPVRCVPAEVVRAALADAAALERLTAVAAAPAHEAA